MANILIIVVVVGIIGLAVRYIHKEKKRGVKCIGCPEGCSCGGSCGCDGGDASCSGCCGGNME